MSPLTPSQNIDNQSDQTLFLDFYRTIEPGDENYVQNLILSLFGEEHSLKIEAGDLDSSIKVTGNIFEINQLKDAFSRGIGLDSTLRSKVAKNLMLGAKPDSIQPAQAFTPLKIAPSPEMQEAGVHLIRKALKRTEGGMG